jgi:SAM-dependent methyltransferase
METTKTRHRVVKYTEGNGLDIGCNRDKIKPDCIGIDLYAATGVNLIGKADTLPWFENDVFDFVYSSHTLEDIQSTDIALKEWLRVIKPGGYLILYLPHKDYYPNIGHELANKAHKHDFVPEDILAPPAVGTTTTTEPISSIHF